MIQDLTLDYPLHFRSHRRRRQLQRGSSPPSSPPGRIPRVARLMALAIHLDRLLDECGVANQAELAQLGRVSRARLTQILNLRNLAPDIQEEILFLPPTQQGCDIVTERHLRPLLGSLLWSKQRAQWSELKRAIEVSGQDHAAMTREHS